MFPTHHAIQLEVDPEAPASAREFVRRWCRTSRRRGDVDVVLAASELVSLFVQTDADARIGVRIEPHDGGVILSVTAARTACAEPDDLASEVLDQIADRWEVEASPFGLRAWAEVAAPPEEH